MSGESFLAQGRDHFIRMGIAADLRARGIPRNLDDNEYAQMGLWVPGVSAKLVGLDTFTERDLQVIASYLGQADLDHYAKAAAADHRPPPPRGIALEAWGKHAGNSFKVEGVFARREPYAESLADAPPDGAWHKARAVATLYPDPANPNGKGHAVAIWVNGGHAGYFPSDESARCFDDLCTLRDSGYSIHAPISMNGAYSDERGRWGYAGWLSLPPADLIAPVNRIPSNAAVLPEGRPVKVKLEKQGESLVAALANNRGRGAVAVTLRAVHKANARRDVPLIEAAISGQVIGHLSETVSSSVLPLVRRKASRGDVSVARGIIEAGPTLMLRVEGELM
ncbi:hypothetical protein [Brachybacterium kimchii]|uniref:HIRAN domain-containing protein n=1 Tax=Brachybacterium kimchii TaxID=2942909 RepID=A0ABY4NBC8_9MICO|nr:hypothetical protein [Brachybacterium kimchii]UQN30695.1 hypothetical protein M4486_05165 [Brachybacterium kimchii]